MSIFRKKDVNPIQMKKLNNIEKLIWEKSVFADLPRIPEVDDAWMRLEQRMTIADTEPDKGQNQAAPFPLVPILGWQPRLSNIVSLALAALVCLPIVYHLLTTESVLTRYGSIETVLLNDGSSVTLNSSSKLTYKTDFNSDHRNVTLSGEAFFDVQPGLVPFVIHTDYGEVKVLGTTFNVHARPDRFEVGVNTGMVLVSNQTKSIILTRGQRIDVEPSEIHLGSAIESYHDYPDWIHNKLVCEQTPLREVCDEIERIFDISFTFTDPSLADVTVTGVLDASDLNSVLSTISLLTQHEFKFDGETCTIL